ncbi:Conserved membrane protein [Alkalibacterium sp. AK22]|uniref:TraX family protein n=1 Tax=Alkalibacterium sp. AK22 TaxID=1229520 RepID=UPI000452FD5A|nr:TraX family protein [Alkalibacterium sp. AK22]EXJ22719.1 Conserved membrane protein [Alkalibacterium sp. AK22]
MTEKSSPVLLEGAGVNANVLKAIAVSAMFIDHFSHLISDFGTPERWIAHLIGRLAAPLICYLIAEGHYYTSSKSRYIWRLFLFALVSHVPYNLYFGFGLFGGTSIIWTLMLGLIALSVIKNDKHSVPLKVIILGLTLMLSMPANWHYIGVLWIVVFGLYRDHFRLKMLMFALVALVFYIVPGLQDMGMYASYRFGSLLAIPLFVLYNGKPGLKNKFTKWVFYWFYPLHLLVLAFIRFLM